MARFAVKDEVEAFAAAVVPLVVPKNARDWRVRVQKMWDGVQARGFADKTDASKKLYMSLFRKGVREALAKAEPDDARRDRVEKALMAVLRIDTEVLSRVQERYKERVKAGNRDLMLVPQWEALLSAFRDMLTDQDARLRAIAVMALSGRRFAEVLQFATLAPSIDKVGGISFRHRWLLDFSGQLKTRGGVATTAGKTFRIPTLAPAAQVLTAFRSVRESLEGQAWAEASSRQLSTTLNPEFNRVLRDSAIGHLWPKSAPLSIKELRALYAEVAYHGFGPRSDRAPYFARILGHSEDDLTTALSYIRFSLSEAALKAGQEEMNRLSMLREEQAQRARAAKGDEESADGEEPEADEAVDAEDVSES